MPPPLNAKTYRVSRRKRTQLSFSGAARALGVSYGFYAGVVHKKGNPEHSISLSYHKNKTSQYLNGTTEVFDLTDGATELLVWFERPSTLHFEAPDPFDEYARAFCGFPTDGKYQDQAANIAEECARLGIPDTTRGSLSDINVDGVLVSRGFQCFDNSPRTQARGAVQVYFRMNMLRIYKMRCAFCNLAAPEVLEAAHILPWADCQTDDERGDVANGLLLCANHHRLFDARSLGIGITNFDIEPLAGSPLGSMALPQGSRVSIAPEHASKFAGYLSRRYARSTPDR